MNKKVLTGIVLLSVVAPLAAFAQVTPPANANYTSYTGISNFITNVIGGWLFGLLTALAVIFILFAAYLYLTAGGDDEKIKKAKSMIIYALVAVAIGLLARALVGLISTAIGTS